MSLAPVTSNTPWPGFQDKEEKVPSASPLIVLYQAQGTRFHLVDFHCKMALEDAVPRKLWEHQSPESTQMWKFLKSMENVTGLTFPVRYHEADVNTGFQTD